MKLAFSTNAYTRFSLIDALRGIKSAGYDGVEILADKPHAYPADLDADHVKRIRDELDRLNLAVSNINANCSFGYWTDAPPEPYFEPSLISPNPRHREDRTNLIYGALQFARDVGAANISITSGRCLGGMPPDRAARQFAESIKPILERAERLGVNVGIECEPGLLLEYSDELYLLIKELGHPRLGANWDVGHSVVAGESINHAVDLLADRLWNLHVEDLPGRKHYHMIPGEGTFDWAHLKDALESINYNRFLTVELYTHTQEPQLAAEKSITFLKRQFA